MLVCPKYYLCLVGLGVGVSYPDAAKLETPIKPGESDAFWEPTCVLSGLDPPGIPPNLFLTANVYLTGQKNIRGYYGLIIFLGFWDFVVRVLIFADR